MDQAGHAPPGFSVPHFRLYPGAVLLRCRHDIRCLLEEDEYRDPEPREVFLLLRVDDEGLPLVTEIGGALAGLLSSATGWRPLDAAAEILHGLRDRGYVEIA